MFIADATHRAYGFVREHAPTIATPQQMLKNVEKIALPAIGLVALANLPGVDSGPIFGSWCLLACVPLVEAPPLLALCIAACAAAGVSPTP